LISDVIVFCFILYINLCANKNYYFKISGDAITSPELSNSYQRRKLLRDKKENLRESYIELGPVPENPKLQSIIVFDPKEVVQNLLTNHTLQPVNHLYESQSKGSPRFVQHIKQLFGDELITGYMDSPSAKEIMKGVPEIELPAVMLGIYADGVDRDSMGHSTLVNRVHATYVKILNLSNFGLREQDDYRLIQIGYEDSLRKFGYNRFHKHLVSKLVDLVNDGIIINQKKHAVRLCYLQVLI